MKTSVMQILASKIRFVFSNFSSYQFDRHTPAFSQDGHYSGDAYMTTIFEPQVSAPPIFYHTFSPYDVISKQAPQRATVFQGGTILLDIDFASYIAPRTGVMTPIVAGALGLHDIDDKRLLFIGTGKIARQSLLAFKALFPEINQVDFVNTGSTATEFINQATVLDVATRRAELSQLSDYDIVVCHSSSKAPVLTSEMISSIKSGALLASFASEDSADIAPEFYAAKGIRVITDWAKTVAEASDLKTAIELGWLNENDVVVLPTLLRNNIESARRVPYTIYRSHGTPMQNLAVLKCIMLGEIAASQPKN